MTTFVLYTSPKEVLVTSIKQESKDAKTWFEEEEKNRKSNEYVRYVAFSTSGVVIDLEARKIII